MVDPTAGQFPSRGVFEYVPLPPGKEPTGHCLGCGDVVFDGETFCSDECGKRTDAYMRQVAGGNW